MRKLAIVLVAAACAAPSAATAHPVLESSSPPSDKARGVGAPADAGGALKMVELDFSEPVLAKFSGAVIEDGDGRKVALGPAGTDAADAKRLVVPLASPLPPGRYTVEWHAVAEDTHRVKGRYSFTISR